MRLFKLSNLASRTRSLPFSFWGIFDEDYYVFTELYPTVFYKFFIFLYKHYIMYHSVINAECEGVESGGLYLALLKEKKTTPWPEI